MPGAAIEQFAKELVEELLRDTEFLNEMRALLHAALDRALANLEPPR